MKSRKNKSHNILRAFTVSSSMTLLSRITGYLRDAIIAAFLGASPHSDAFFVAFRIPNMFRRLFGEGALTPAIVPVVSEILQNDKKDKEIQSIIGTTMLVVGLITIFGIILAPYIVKVLAYGFSKDSELFHLTVTLTRITFPYLFFISLVAVFMGILNATHHFFAPSFSPVLLNLSMIASLIVLRLYIQPVYALAIGVLIGGGLQLLFQLPFLKENKLPFLPLFDYKTKAVREVYDLILPSLFGLAITQINVLIDTLVASFLKPGTISYLYYADRLLELPIGIFTISFASALLPSISSKAIEKNNEGVVKDFNKTLVNCFIFILPSMAFLLFFGSDIITILFRRKAFDLEAVTGSYKALIGYSIGLPFFTFNRLITPLFYAYKQTKDPVKAGFIAMWVNIIMDIILMPLGALGLSSATTLSAIANATFLHRFFIKKHYALLLNDSIKKSTKILISSIIPAIFLKTIILNLVLPAETFILKVFLLFSVAILYLFLYLTCLTLFKIEELRIIWTRLQRI
jgi:putative peptidoglycan lipid II flippase